MKPFPSYIPLAESGELAERAEAIAAMLHHCTLCPHSCKVNRTEGEVGFCGAPGELIVSSAGPHFGEERPLSGSGGSGTIFFAHCNSHCIFCQNHDISQDGRGRAYTAEQLAGTMLRLQNQGCHNCNLVTPTHFLPGILRALQLAIEDGFRLPLVYNTNAYDRLEILRLLDGIVDIYLPDMKFGDTATAEDLTGMKDYPQVSREALMEMHRQTGLLSTDAGGIARKGVIVRHLVLPDDLSASASVFATIAGIDREITVNIMAQYYPAYRAHMNDSLTRMIRPAEYQQAVSAARKSGLKNIITQ